PIIKLIANSDRFMGVAPRGKLDSGIGDLRGGPARSGFWAGSQHDVPPRGELADPGALDRGEVHAEARVPLGVAGPDLVELPVPLVAREDLDEALGRQQLLVPLPDPRVDVRRGAAPVGDRLDRPEVVFAGRAGQEAAISLEVRVEVGLA